MKQTDDYASYLWTIDLFSDHNKYINKMSKWKDIKPTERLNRILASKKTLPSKFAPPRDRSESVDKLFNNSRSRLHSSL